MRHRSFRISLFLMLVVTLAGGASWSALAQDATPADSAAPSATPSAPTDVTLSDASGTEVGTATFTEADGMVTVSVSVDGLEPGEHGIHIHEMGECDPEGAEPFSSAGSHYNPTGAMHGAPDDPESHAGDLGNIIIADDGTGQYEIATDKFTLSSGPTSLFDADGSALLIHAMTDDLMSDPSGMSGSRIACGVIAEPTDQAGAQRQAEEQGQLNSPAEVPFSEDLLASLQVPEGFEISVFATGLTNPRMMAVTSDGVVLVSQRNANNVVALRDVDGDGVVDEAEAVASDLPYVHGLAIHENQLFMAGNKTIWVADLQPNGVLGAPQVLVDDLPEGGQHPNNTIAVGPDAMLYISIGSPCNACPGTNDEYATILRMNLDGSERTIFASGLRNTIGWGWHPETGELWGFDHGSDWRGDDQPPEEVNLIAEGSNYGWPYCYADQQVDEYTSQAPVGSTAEQYCALTESPVLTYQAHSAPIGWTYYTADQFPADYQGDAFVAMRGSWNRAEPTGYKVVRVDFENGQPVAIDDFATGWLSDDGTEQYGRLAGVLVMPDGSLLVADDSNGVIYRISYAGA